ncbi:scarecrow-like protein 21 [Diospyros lotus]|uniref:scarecrow-like protein 21 n=1 Tax=Diospyros lotus TaxID=55363 RepID=UPI00225187A7|nr:scarecrow-like protein 21 [Diospyros lotus]XP_052208181.1 scarecrow-like protein 21 [Diospyros lotus]XP_052208182.1 scarecrow-like protein 21 [Diospyros lotus]XP_052208183.1 scarecrow-like protein 21 [Diospyros lotus]
MKASSKQGNSDASGRMYYQPVQEVDSYTWHPSQNADVGLSSEVGDFCVQPPEQLCTFESSAATGCYPFRNSPSTGSFSPLGSPVSAPDSVSCSGTGQFPHNTVSSAVSGICLTDNDNEFGQKLRELEAAMLGPDPNILEARNIAITGGLNLFSPDTKKWKQVMDISKRSLKDVLIACAKAVADSDLSTAEFLLSELRQMVSVSGDPLQRIGAYMLESIVARLASSGNSIYKALKCEEPASSELLSYMHLLYEVCPYFKFGYMSANGAIAGAMKDEKRIHIIDFQIAQGTQWITLIQALAARPGGPPQIRITGVDDSTSASARGGGLDIIGKRLTRFAESCKVPFEFHGVPLSGSQVEIKDLKVQPGEPLAVNFAFMLHHMPDENVGIQNHRDRLLRLVKNLSPKLVTLVEQESDTCTASFLPRFIETLDYYLAIFESIDETLPRGHKDRINVEQHCLAREIVNIIACEGSERVERHELLGKWRSRFLMAGFKPYPLNSVVNATIKSLLKYYSERYRLEERDGALYLGWMSRDLVTSCAWR